MLTLGHIANPELDVETAGEVYAIKTLSNEGRPFRVTTDADGRLWLIVGTDSGFEGPTAVYYSQISFVLTRS